ncbi:unnamed protein product [Amoebophrya sp. A25]|nr:unnamed protein product [Amoebophrya sp. A25]|eukprot:GSA25T00017766001.1
MHPVDLDSIIEKNYKGEEHHLHDQDFDIWEGSEDGGEGLGQQMWEVIPSAGEFASSASSWLYSALPLGGQNEDGDEDVGKDSDGNAEEISNLGGNTSPTLLSSTTTFDTNRNYSKSSANTSNPSSSSSRTKGQRHQHSLHSTSSTSSNGGADETRSSTSPTGSAGATSSTATSAFSLRHLKQSRALLFELFRGNFKKVRHLSHGAFNELYSAYQTQSAAGSLFAFFHGDDSSSADEQVSQSPVARFLRFVFLLLQRWLSTFLDVIIQGMVFMAALFYMLKSRVSVLHYVDEFLAVIDSSRMCYHCVERVLRAILYSAVKMCVFYTLYTWWICSFFEVPLVFIPTVLAGAMALVPVIDPIYIPVLANIYVYVKSGTMWPDATLCAFINGMVWWNVTVAIYMEIPESNPWLTGLGVVLGISHFGVKGVVLGPVLVTLPLLCYELLFVFNASVAEQGTTVPSPNSPRKIEVAAPATAAGGRTGWGGGASVGGRKLGDGMLRDSSSALSSSEEQHAAQHAQHIDDPPGAGTFVTSGGGSSSSSSRTVQNRAQEKPRRRARSTMAHAAPPHQASSSGGAQHQYSTQQAEHHRHRATSADHLQQVQMTTATSGGTGTAERTRHMRDLIERHDGKSILREVLSPMPSSNTRMPTMVVSAGTGGRAGLQQQVQDTRSLNVNSRSTKKMTYNNAAPPGQPHQLMDRQNQTLSQQKKSKRDKRTSKNPHPPPTANPYPISPDYGLSGDIAFAGMEKNTLQRQHNQVGSHGHRAVVNFDPEVSVRDVVEEDQEREDAPEDGASFSDSSSATEDPSAIASKEGSKESTLVATDKRDI